ncbi:MAG: HU family DNA-binding protein [Patescibacteria group bacterium]|nr:HU family DNA-binding protein [Patescibacteria group bacterium]MDD5172770.1 HU family DNA-binding protein [Patescibacteria group bacterium]
MNKKELIEKLTKEAKACSMAEAGRCLDSFIKIVKNALKAGDKVAIAGFGTFSVSKRAARTGINPQTRAKIQIPATKVPKFKAGQGFKKSVK